MTSKILGPIFVLMLSLTGLSAIAHQGHDMPLASSPPSTDSIFNLNSEWTNQDGQKISLFVLKGHPAIVAMIYTSCQSACPLIAEDMKKIEEHLPKSNRGQVRFALFSFDNTRDNAAALKKYSKARKLGSDWILAQGSSNAVRELAAALGVQYKKSPRGDFEHSNLITLLDAEGVVKKQQSGIGNSGDDMAQAASQLIKK